MHDILVPLCSKLGMTLVTSAGFQAIRNAVKLLKRVEKERKADSSVLHQRLRCLHT
jgi:hypothetical protein